MEDLVALCGCLKDVASIVHNKRKTGHYKLTKAQRLQKDLGLVNIQRIKYMYNIVSNTFVVLGDEGLKLGPFSSSRLARICLLENVGFDRLSARPQNSI